MADEKYRLTLEGSEIDEALLRLANYEDEGLVLGSRKGVMLGPGSEYYHKNARYYAELAQSAVPGDTTSAVRWDIDQSALTDADREMARKNIRAGRSNRNLLDNPWWGLNEVVNQRENTSGQTTVSYSIDRWRMTAGSAYGNWSLDENGLTITAASGTYAVFQQLLEPRLYRYLAGKTVTCSALLSDGTVVSGTVQSVDWSSNTTVVVSGNLRLWLVSGGIFRVLVQNGDTFTIRAVKLELGSVSTLANDVPPDYWEEYRKCRRYFKRLGPWQSGSPLIGRANSDSSAVFVVGDEPMAKMTGITATKTGAVYVRAGNNTNNAVTAVSASTTVGGGVVLGCTTSGLTAYSSAIIVIAADSYIDLSADL